MPAAVEVGRVCVKLTGREAGRKCVIVSIIDKNFALITGPKELTGVRRRRVNIDHIEPTEVRVKITKGASDEDVLKAIKEAGLEEWMAEVVKPKIKPF